MTLDWIFSTVFAPITALTNWFLSLLEACGMKAYFFYVLGVGFIVLQITRSSLPVSGGDVAQARIRYSRYDSRHNSKED